MPSTCSDYHAPTRKSRRSSISHDFYEAPRVTALAVRTSALLPRPRGISRPGPWETGDRPGAVQMCRAAAAKGGCSPARFPCPGRPVGPGFCYEIYPARMVQSGHQAIKTGLGVVGLDTIGQGPTHTLATRL
ncbi:hypothetical protein G7Z17_g8207 [Cylindrodendrum hubeiense]|uniref:Uncharacterized protein n=1 Tax=Cylindrodendrum hubeiense TaxID=595255 RepID=A0A9P5H445_9HYPO|nr:hypothetical protein G7Z17_g8207 [Cylindrodendrum hubeiense]